MLCSNLLYTKYTPTVMNFDTIRELSEINEYGVADTYPWISDDGLRIYFQKNNLIYNAHRNSDNEFFSNIEYLTINFLNEDNIAPWLSQDQLELFFTKRNPSELGCYLYKATRNSIDENFDNLTQINLLGWTDVKNKIYFIARPSFTPDKNQMFIYHSYQNNNILILNKTAENEYTLADSLQIPENYSLTPGYLSYNGLRYYLSLYPPNESEARLYFFERDSINEKFSRLYYINNNIINASGESTLHTYITNNQNYCVYLRSPNSWNDDDIFIAQNNAVDTKKMLKNNFNLYPNPAEDYIFLEFNETIEKNSIAEIYSLSGILMQYFKLKYFTKKIKFYTKNLNNGTYILKIVRRNKILSKKFFIQK